MDTTKLKKFAQFARRALIEQVAAKLEAVRADGAAAQREHPAAFKKLEASIAQHGTEEVIERVAYIWFNRFTALRFLDVNDLNAVRVVSPLPGQFQPEILADAKAGNINEQLVPEATRRKVRDLLEGLTPSQDPQAEAYRLLLVAICNSWQTTMPFLFERIDDYTELLLPADLLSNASILAYLREAMTPDACQDVEIIGWLYQFYISEKKDQVFAALKKNKKITAENIPAATQLFTPHWIVRYLVENSLGRLWLLNRPGSKLAERMDYYIAPEEPEADFVMIGKPEQIRVCDPACGSGHMLTYAFDLLYAIYEEEGYEADKIPALILANNLTGVEIDDRAGALAAFALAMKAAAKLGRRRFLRMEAKPDICVMQDVKFTPAELRDVAAVVGKDLFTDELRETLGQFEQAKNFGSLIVPKLRDPAETLRVVAARDFGGDLLLKEVQERVIAVLRMAEALSPKYHIVVANPPYMGSSNMNAQLKNWTQTAYPEGKSDIYAMFLQRALLFCPRYCAMITMQSWMFQSSFERLRDTILSRAAISSMLHLGTRAFDTIGGAVVAATAFVLLNGARNQQGCFVRLTEGQSEREKSAMAISAIGDPLSELRYKAATSDFASLPGEPIIYWASNAVKDAFNRYPRLSDTGVAASGIQTSDNERYLRFWHEVSSQDVFSELKSFDEAPRGRCWVPHNKGGEFRRWYGNQDYLIKWHFNGSEAGSDPKFQQKNMHIQKHEAATWSHTSGGSFSVRYSPPGRSFNVEGPIYINKEDQEFGLGFLASKGALFFMGLLNPSLHFLVGSVQQLPVCAK